MKNLSLLFLIFIAFSCSKEEKTTSSNVTQRSNSDATWCDELIEGEPTSVTGYYTYPSELISTSPNFKFYVNYNALTVKNRFDIYDGIGTLVASTNAYVMGTGTLTFIVCPDSPLPFRLVVKAYSATKATDKWNVNITCSPYSCIPVDSCCDKVFLDAQWSVDADRPGCCI
ncbi:MAG: hypothetical protein IPO92_24365 [Saprospiraceae bacterium]|nr:hypothetical protein [Saprospiraceae bacterium]